MTDIPQDPLQVLEDTILEHYLRDIREHWEEEEEDMPVQRLALRQDHLVELDPLLDKELEDIPAHR